MTLRTRIRGLKLFQCLSGPRNEIEDELRDDEPLEEERLAHYDPTRFLPIRIGQVFLRRYKIVAKLGYGSQATIWLCFDKTARIYLVFKVVTALPWKSSSLPYERKSREMMADAACRSAASMHPESLGAGLIRTIESSFLINSYLSPGRSHLCILHRPALIDVGNLQRRMKWERFDANALRFILKSVLAALDFLHTKAKIVHCDVKADNILCTSSIERVYHDIAKKLGEQPAVMKIDKRDRRRIYKSIDLVDFVDEVSYDQILLGDFGEAEMEITVGEQKEWMPMCNDQYRPPEIHLEMEWGTPIDIWAVGVLAWRLFYNQLLFGGSSDRRSSTTEDFLSRMHAVLGPPPADFLGRNKMTRCFWNDKGEWIGKTSERPVVWDWAVRESRLEGDEKHAFTAFLRSMLCWRPEDRKTADQLLADPWLNEDFEGPTEKCALPLVDSALCLERAQSL